MIAKLLKVTVRSSGNSVYVGRIYRTHNAVSGFGTVEPFTRVPGNGFPASVPVSQRYMKTTPLAAK